MADVGRYQLVRIVEHFKKVGVDRGKCEGAVTAYLIEGVEQKAQEVVHYAFEGYEKRSRSGGDDDDYGRKGRR